MFEKAIELVTGFIPGFSMLKLFGVGITVFTIYTTVGAAKDYVQGLNDTIAEQSGELIKKGEVITSLKLENATAKESINSMRIQYESEKNASQEKDDTIAELIRTIDERERNDRLTALMEGRRKSLLLRVINKSAECEVLNYNNYGGECVGGKWREK